MNTVLQEDQRNDRSSCYEHIRDSRSKYDAQTLDSATDEQQQMTQRPRDQDDERKKDNDGIADEDFEMLPDQELMMKVAFLSFEQMYFSSLSVCFPPYLTHGLTVNICLFNFGNLVVNSLWL